MAACYKDGVVLGADSRTSTGSYIANRVTDKLTRLTDRIYVCRSGSAADTQVSPEPGLDDPLASWPPSPPRSRCWSHAPLFAPLRLQNLSAYVIWFLEQHSMELGKEPEVLTAAKLLAKLAYENKSALQAGLIVAGWDEHRGGQVRE